MRFSTLLASLLFVTVANAGPPAAVFTDPPLNKAHPASMAYVRIPTHGDRMNGMIYIAAGAGPHPAVVLFHGFPGNEQNLDLAQAMRRAGFNVLTLHYRGSWGSPGTFSFSHAIEDADAAVDFLRTPAIAAKYGIDGRRIYAAGHSMGGFMAASVAAHDPAIAGLIMISAWDIGVDGGQFHNRAIREAAVNAEFRNDVIPLAGTTPDRLMDEAENKARAWDFVDWAPALKSRPVLLIAADDGNYPDSHRLAQALIRAGDRSVAEIHMTTDHSYSDHRIALESAVLEWLSQR